MLVALTGSALGAALLLVLVTAALLFLALAGSGGFALLALALGGKRPLASLLLGNAPGLGLAVAGLGERALAGVFLLVGEGAQQHAACRALGRLRRRSGGTWRSRGGRLRRARRDRLLDLGPGDAALDFHDDLLRTPMREALANSALLDRPLQRQGLGRVDGQSLVARVFGIGHSAFGPAGSVVSSVSFWSDAAVSSVR